MMHRKPNKRHSAPSAAAGSAFMSSQQMVPSWGGMGGPPPMYYGWAPQATGQQVPMFSQQQVAKPWEEPSDSDSDSDFQPSQKRRKLTHTTKKVTDKLSTTVKRGRGRPRKESVPNETADDVFLSGGRGRPKEESVSNDTADAEFLSKVPKALLGFDSDSSKLHEKCKNCNFNKGVCLLKPCGHALFCKSCVNGLREEMIQMKRASKCMMEGCYAEVADWMSLINVSA